MPRYIAPKQAARNTKTLSASAPCGTCSRDEAEAKMWEKGVALADGWSILSMPSDPVQAMQKDIARLPQDARLEPVY